MTLISSVGDDAKLMSLVCPSNTHRYVYKREGDDERLLRQVYETHQDSMKPEHTGNLNQRTWLPKIAILFPSDDAICLEQYLESFNSDITSTQHQPLSSNVSKEGSQKSSPEASKDRAENQPLHVIVLDSTWKKARRMKHHLCRLFLRNFQQICRTGNAVQWSDIHVGLIKLKTDTVSVYSRTQSQPGRICSVEACALLLQELGEDEVTCSAIIEPVKLNNRALKFSFVDPRKMISHSEHKKEADKLLWEPTSRLKRTHPIRNQQPHYTFGHPCWYYGNRANGSKQEVWL